MKEKRLGGKGKLTNAIIDKLQNNYCIAIRQNKDNMQGAVKATLFHVLLDQRIIIIISHTAHNVKICLQPRPS